MGEAELDALLVALEELKPHVDPCECGDCKPITDAAAAIRRLRETVARVEQHKVFPDMFASSPCVLCGYQGVGYYQPNVHACAKLFHEHVNGVVAARKTLASHAP